MKPEKILITGAAGFIGFHLAKRLLQEGHKVVGLDNINDYYDVNLKYARLVEKGVLLTPAITGRAGQMPIPPKRGRKAAPELVASIHYPNYRFTKMHLEDSKGIMDLFAREKFDFVVHLAAQAGVRYSLKNPQAYIDANITGTLNILEACRAYPVRHLIYASSSSVYGLNSLMPFSVQHSVDHPVSLYAATKKANELMAHTYSHLFRIPATGLRFFTVYGPWGRPDMALFLFTKAILEEKPIEVYNNGNMLRDFTFIDDIVEGIVRLLERPPLPDSAWNSDHPNPESSACCYKLHNIGNSSPVQLMDFIKALENSLQKKAILKMMPIQPGDVPATWADTSSLEKVTGFKPGTSVELGIERFVAWYRSYFKV